MPSGVYTRTEQTKINISNALKGIIPSKETLEKRSKALMGHVGYWLGKKRPPCSEATKQKMSISAKKAKRKKGYKRPPFTKEWKDNLSKSHQGIKCPNRKPRPPMSEEQKKKISESNKGKKGNCSMKGKKHTELTKAKMREKAIINRGKNKQKDTSIELKVEAELIKRNINYQKQVPLCKVARVDFYLPEYRIVIQADGDYWHNLPGVKDRDKKQDDVLTFNGFNVYRFLGSEINKSVEECINKLII